MDTDTLKGGIILASAAIGIGVGTYGGYQAATYVYGATNSMLLSGAAAIATCRVVSPVVYHASTVALPIGAASAGVVLYGAMSAAQVGVNAVRNVANFVKDSLQHRSEKQVEKVNNQKIQSVSHEITNQNLQEKQKDKNDFLVDIQKDIAQQIVSVERGEVRNKEEEIAKFKDMILSLVENKALEFNHLVSSDDKALSDVLDKEVKSQLRQNSDLASQITDIAEKMERASWQYSVDEIKDNNSISDKAGRITDDIRNVFMNTEVESIGVAYDKGLIRDEDKFFEKAQANLSNSISLYSGTEELAPSSAKLALGSLKYQKSRGREQEAQSL